MIKIDSKLELEIRDNIYRVGFISEKTTPTYYWHEHGCWQALNEHNLIRRLKIAGIRSDGTSEDNRRVAAEIDEVVVNIQTNHKVAAALRLGGRKEGVYTNGTFGAVGSNHPLILNVQDSVFTEGEQGDCPFIMNMLTNCIGHEPDQLHTFLGWLKRGRDAIRANEAMPNAYMILVGNVKSGKTVMQDFIITPAFNDMSSDPWKLIAKGNGFNKELCAACHWKTADKALSKYTALRESLTAEMKRIASEVEEVYEPKGVDSITVSINRFASLSANDEEKSLNSLPIIDQRSNADKINLLRVADKFDVGYKIDGANWTRLKQEIKSEIKHFLHMVDNYQAPIRLRDDRYIVKAYHSPYIINKLNESEPFMMLYTMLRDEQVYSTLFQNQTKWINDTAYQVVRRSHVEVTANELEVKLSDILGPRFRDFKSKFPQNWSLGSGLRNLADYLDKVSSDSLIVGGKDLHTKACNKWRISHNIAEGNEEYITEDEYKAIEANSAETLDVL